MREPAVAPALSPAPSPAPFPKTAPNEVTPKLAAPPPAAKKRSASVRAPGASDPAPVQIESADRSMPHSPLPSRRGRGVPSFQPRFGNNSPQVLPPALRFTKGHWCDIPWSAAVRMERGPCQRCYSDRGYLALYQVDTAGNSKLVYPSTNRQATQQLWCCPASRFRFPSSPIKIARAGERLRLIVVPAAPSAALGQLRGGIGGVVNGAVRPAFAEPPRAPPAPLVVDIPLAPN